MRRLHRDNNSVPIHPCPNSPRSPLYVTNYVRWL